MKYLNTALITVLILSTAALLVGRMYNLRFAGGTGYIYPVHITNQAKEEIVQNQPYSSGDSYDRLIITDLFDEKYAGLDLYLSKGTEIIVTNTDPENLTIRLIQGRMVALGYKPFTLLVGDASITNPPLVVSASDELDPDSTDSDLQAPLLHAVFYSWENRVELSTIAGELRIDQPETKNTRVETTELNADASVEKDFFDWTGLEF